MKEILQRLADYQQRAADSGISFDLNLYFNSERVPFADVKMYYSVAGDITKFFTFTTTFDTLQDDKNTRKKYSNIEHFIETVNEPTDNK